MNQERRDFDICAGAQTLTDICVDVGTAELQVLNLAPGTHRLIERRDYQALLERLEGRPMRRTSGGAAVNSLVIYAQLGGRAALVTALGDDAEGIAARDDLSALGVALAPWESRGRQTGTCISLIGSDGERTMSTCLADSGQVIVSAAQNDYIQRSQWLLLESYLLGDPGYGERCIDNALAAAKAAGCSIALTLSSTFIIHAHQERVRALAKMADVVLGNASEALALSGHSRLEDALRWCHDELRHAVVTDGNRGAFLWEDGNLILVPAQPAEIRDATGAGDVFAGAYLFGLHAGLGPRESAHRAAALAAHAVMSIGSRLSGDVAEKWRN